MRRSNVKDKNGNFICEGDVITGSGVDGIVKLRDGNFVIEWLMPTIDLDVPLTQWRADICSIKSTLST